MKMVIKRGHQLKWTKEDNQSAAGEPTLELTKRRRAVEDNGDDSHDNDRQDCERRYNWIDSQMRMPFAHTGDRRCQQQDQRDEFTDNEAQKFDSSRCSHF